MKKSKKVLALALAAMMTVSAFAGCGGKDDGKETTKDNTQQSSSTKETTTKEEPFELSIMLPYGDHAHDELDLTINFRKMIEDYTNTKVTYELYSDTAYYEKLTLKYASGELTTVIVTSQVLSKDAEFMNACKYNTFWNITDQVDLFDNLTTIPDAVRMNASLNGKLYGIPRSRDVGRNACSYRQDWADNLGIESIETIDDLYELAVAFTQDDPDQNGKNDTYGFGLDGWMGAWDIMQPWFGVPNQWGISEDGQDLVYYAMTEEYKNALKTFRQWNSEGLINEGWQDLSPGAADKTIFRNNIAGIYVQVADSTRRTQEAMNGSAEKPGAYPEARFTYFGALDGGYGLNVLPTDGYAGFIAVAKSVATTEDDLMATLQFLNDMNDAEMRNLVDFGVEGVDHKIDPETGYAAHLTNDEKTALGISTSAYRGGYNQMVAYFSNAEETAKLIGLDPSTNSDIRNACTAIMADNAQYVIANYGASYTSQTYIDQGADLNKILEDAKKAYILGEIDETGLQAELDRWLEVGGQKVIDEMNAAYDAARAN